MAGVTRSQFTELMKKDAYTYFWEAYDETPPVYQEVFDEVPSDAAYNQYTSAIGLGDLLEKPEGEDLQADSPLESYTIVCANKTFGRITRLTYEAMKDAQRGVNLLRDTVGTWGRSFPRTKDKWYSNFFNYGAYSAGNALFNNTISQVVTDSSGNYIYDGHPFFDTDHPDKVGNTYSNYNSSYTLTHDNFKTVWLQYTDTNAKDERNNRIELVPDVLLLPAALKFTAQEILNSTLIPGIFDNTTNVLKAIVSPLEWGQLTDTDGWFLGKRKHGLTATSREGVQLDFWQDEVNKDFFASIMARWGGCVTNWRYFIANATSTS